ncbi:hypothetical protein BS17DRAFT_704202 [Gyrodon lividus]|nr:hypothetical protein BS17DRAFT_704202 [Gyrodon lividus]
MACNQLYPLEVNVTTGEPFLRLLAPHQNIIITPPRDGDEVKMTSILNDTRVVLNFATIPIPYTLEEAQVLLKHSKEQTDAILEDLRAFELEHPTSPPKIVGGCPVRCIREVRGDGTDVYIGNVWVYRGAYEDVLDPMERAKVVEENNRKPAGDSSIRWAFGDYLIPSHHGQGIMSAAIGLILCSWMVPRMGVHHIEAFTFAENIASERVFVKNGFIKVAVIDNGKVVRGERRKLNYLAWTKSEL